MACCCGKPKVEESLVVDVVVSESEEVEPEIIIEIFNVGIQVDVEDLQNNVYEDKPKKPRFVSVYLAAANENMPRYMLAKNIHHKDRTQYTYIENKEQGLGNPIAEEGETDKKHIKRTSSQNSVQDCARDEPLERSGSTLIHVAESDSAHDFSAIDQLSDNAEDKSNDISSDIQIADGSKWNRGVNTDDASHESEKETHPEENIPSDVTNAESGTMDSGIYLESLSEADIQKDEPVSHRSKYHPLPVEEDIIVAGSLADISNIRQITVDSLPAVPKNRGTTIDHEWRLSELKRIYDPRGIDYSKVKINSHGKMIIMRERSRTQSNISSTDNS